MDDFTLTLPPAFSPLRNHQTRPRPGRGAGPGERLCAALHHYLPAIEQVCSRPPAPTPPPAHRSSTPPPPPIIRRFFIKNHCEKEVLVDARFLTADAGEVPLPAKCGLEVAGIKMAFETLEI